MIEMSVMPVPVYLFKLNQLFHRPHLNVTDLEMGKEKNNYMKSSYKIHC